MLGAGAPLVGWEWCERAAHRDAWPTIEVRLTSPGGESGAPVTSPEESARLLLSTLTREEREDWGEELEALLASEEARRSPALVDFLEMDGDKWLDAQRPWLLPAIGAGAALLAGRWASDGLEVAVVEGIGASMGETEPDPGAHGSRRMPAWPLPATQTDPTLRRVSLLAWPLIHAVLLEAETESQAEEAAERLRPRSRQPSGTIALVLDATCLAELDPGRSFRERSGVASHCARPQTSPGGDTTTDVLLRAVCRPGGDARPAWLMLGSCQLLVVPRLRAFADRRRFLAEIRAGLGDLTSEVALSNVNSREE